MTAAAIWTDFETTGLYADKHCVLEVGLTVVDENLHIVDEYHAVLGYDEKLFGPMSDFIKKMHGKNGLLEIVARSTLTADQVDAQIGAFVVKNFPHEKPYLGGNSVHFDKDFFKKWFPVSFKLVSHRMIDVSSMWQARKLFAPKTCPERTKDSKHRSIADNRDSIELLRLLLA